MSIYDKINEAMHVEDITLIYILSYDLKDAHNEYGPINAELEKAGYSRDSNLGEATIPRNLFAGRKIVNYDTRVQNLETVIEEQSSLFEAQVIEILEKHAKGKFDKVFVSVSVKEQTAIRLKQS